MGISPNSLRTTSSLVARLLDQPFFFALALLVGCSVPASKVRVPEPTAERLSQTGIASWYGPGFHGKATASGQTYNQNDFTAAHQTLPLGTRVRVVNLDNCRQVVVRVNDRGPYGSDRRRIIDLSEAAARQLDFAGKGEIPVRLEVLADADAGVPPP